MINTIYFSSNTEKYFELSNFYIFPFEYSNRIWQSVEHSYQAHKSDNYHVQEAIRKAKNPSIAKKLGRLVELRSDWESSKLFWMRDMIHTKFSYPEMKEILLSTGDSTLVEYAPWGDTFWGVDKDYNGQNNLGIILMNLRSHFADNNPKKKFIVINNDLLR